MPGVTVDGTDFFAVYEAAEEAIGRARRGEDRGALCRLVVVVRDANGKIVHTWQGGEGKELTHIYLMRILGPF